MNGLADYTAAGQHGEGRRKRRVELEEEKRLVASQLQELSRRLPQLEAQQKRGGVSKMGAPSKPTGNVSKKRPAQNAADLSGGAKRQKVEAERQKRVNQIWAQCQTILKALLKSKDAYAFSKPVNPITSKCPDYYDIIKRPMDLGTIQKKFPGRKSSERKPELREYKSPLEFRDDMRLVWSNCRDYNAVGHPVRTMGDALSEQWEKRWTLSGIEAKWDDELRKQELEELELAGGTATIPQQLQTLDEELQEKLQHAEQRPGYAPPQEGAPMSFEQKRRLSIALGQLPGDKVAEVVRIIAEGPSAKNDTGDGEMEVNIDELDTETLWKLERYSSEVLQVIRKKGGASNRAAEGAGGVTGNGNETTFNAADGEEQLGANGAAGSLSSNSSSDSDTDRSQSGSEGEVGSKDLGDSQQSNGVLTNPPRTAGGNDAATLVSATRPPGQPQIIKNMANKKEVKLQNANAWADLTSVQPDTATADPVAGGGVEEDANEDNLWAEFQSREQEQQAREEEKQAQEERLRQEQQKAEEAAKAEAEKLKKEAEFEEAARKKEEEDRINAERAKELEEMQQVGKGTDFSASALDMISNKGQAQVLSSVFGLQRKDEDSDDESDNDANPADIAEEGEVS